MQSKVSPNPGITCAMPCSASVLTQVPRILEGGYSPMTGREYISPGSAPKAHFQA